MQAQLSGVSSTPTQLIDPSYTFEKEDFSNELFYEIFRFLGAQDLLKARQVCKNWKALLEEPFSWKLFLPFGQPKTSSQFPRCVFGLTPALLDQKGAIPSEKLHLELDCLTETSVFKDFSIQNGSITLLLATPNAFVTQFMILKGEPNKRHKTREANDFTKLRYAFNDVWMVTQEEHQNKSSLMAIGPDYQAIEIEEQESLLPFEVHSDLLIYAQSDMQVVLHDLAKQTPLATLPLSPVWFFRPDSPSCLIAQDAAKKNICIYDLDKLDAPQRTLAAPTNLYQLKASSQFIVGRSLEGFLIWNLEAEDAADFCFEIEHPPLNKFFINGLHLIVCNDENHTVKVYHLGTRKMLSHFTLALPSSPQAIGSVQREVYQNLLVVKFADGSLHIYDLLLGKPVLKDPKAAFPKAFSKIQLFEDRLYGIHQDGLYRYQLS